MIKKNLILIINIKMMKNNTNSRNKKLLIKNTCKQINIDIEIDNQNTNTDYYNL